jgi:hypothetical protein
MRLFHETLSGRGWAAAQHAADSDSSAHLTHLGVGEEVGAKRVAPLVHVPELGLRAPHQREQEEHRGGEHVQQRAVRGPPRRGSVMPSAAVLLRGSVMVWRVMRVMKIVNVMWRRRMGPMMMRRRRRLRQGWSCPPPWVVLLLLLGAAEAAGPRHRPWGHQQLVYPI